MERRGGAGKTNRGNFNLQIEFPYMKHTTKQFLLIAAQPCDFVYIDRAGLGERAMKKGGRHKRREGKGRSIHWDIETGEPESTICSPWATNLFGCQIKQDASNYFKFIALCPAKGERRRRRRRSQISRVYPGRPAWSSPASCCWKQPLVRCGHLR